MEVKYIYWIAALLEGEGWFGFADTPQIGLGMTDDDIVAKARDLICPNNKIRIKHPVGNRKTAYHFRIDGNLAIQWMMTVYSLMGRRRKEKIREVLVKWKEMPRRQRGSDYCVSSHPLLIEGEQFFWQTNSTGSKTKICRICRDEQQKEYKDKNREEINRKRKEKREENPEEFYRKQNEYKARKEQESLIKAMAKAQNISIEEARKVFDNMMGRAN